MPREEGEQPAEGVADTDNGLTAEEQAAFESMREASAEPPPSEPPAPESAQDAPQTPTAAAAQTEQQPSAAPTASDDDDLDDGAPAGVEEMPASRRVGWKKYQQLQEELAAERTAKQKMAEEQARLDERLRMINEALTPQPQEPVDEDPEPDPEVDIFAHNAWLRREQVRLRQQLDERLGGLEQTRQAEAADQQVAATYVDDAQRFAAQEPNFGPAYNYLMGVRTAQLALFHFGKDLTDQNNPQHLTPQEWAGIKSEIAREEKALVRQALKTGRSPAHAIYTMARHSGFRPQQQQQPPPPNGARAPANGTRAPAAASPVRAEIERIKNGQNAALSLSGGGGTPAPILDARTLADMPQDKFNDLLDRMSQGELMRIMGEG